jgi:hypothetical protein
MHINLRLALVTMAVLESCVTVHRAAAQDKAPRILAFVVGIEHYADAELDKLQYAADDAQRLDQQLRLVAELDPRSVLLVADDRNNTMLKAHDVRTALQAFVKKIRNDTQVVVYLGGHGTLSDGGSLLYLPSDYSRAHGTGYIAFNEIRSMFSDRINGLNLHNVSLTFLVNMCGAGNAVTDGRTPMSTNDDRDLLEAAQKLFGQETFGLKRWAVLPATPKRRDTFEDPALRGSVFAHHLNEGLAGRAAVNGVVTTGSLLRYVEDNLEEELPRHADFAGDIPLGVTLKLEGASDYLVGSALLASAQAMEHSALDGEAAAHRAALLDLASQRLASVPGRAVQLAGRATLRRAQATALRTGSPDPTLATFISKLGTDAERSEVHQLKELASGPTGPTATLHTLRQALAEGAPFYVLMLTSRNELLVNADPAADLWEAALREFKGLRQLATFGVPPFGPIPPQVFEMLGQWAAEAKSASAQARLIVLYFGVASLRHVPSQPAAIPVAAQVPAPRLMPFGAQEVELISRTWVGPLTIGYLAPFGGVLLAGGPPSHGDVSLLLAAREPNGMTFSGRVVPRLAATTGEVVGVSPARPPAASNAALLAQAFSEGVERLEEYGPLVEFTRGHVETLRHNREWVPGTAAWFAKWGASASGAVVQQQLLPLRRFALHVAAGCAIDRFESCDKVVGPSDPFDLLVDAATADVSNDAGLEAPRYARAAQLMRSIAGRSGPTRGAERTRATLASFATRIDARAEGAKTRNGRRVIVVRFGVEEYTSPLIPDLLGTARDLESYGAAFGRLADRTRSAIIMRDVQMIGTAADLLARLRAERDGLGPNDVLVFVYSGRGASLDGRRYLTTAMTAPCTPAQTDSRSVDSCSLRRWTELVDLWEIAELMRGHWFVALYDAQFTTPVVEGRFDELLDKHLDAGRRQVPRTPQIAFGGLRSAPAVRARFELRPNGSLPQRQLHIWYEGTLTASLDRRSGCVPAGLTGLASPLAAAVAHVSTTATTYREWLTAMAGYECFSSPQRGENTLVAQGSVDQPVYATGEAAELIEYFRTDGARREANLLAAAVIAEEAMGSFPTNRNRIAQAAILLGYAAFRRAYSFPSAPGADPGDAVGRSEQLLTDALLATSEERSALGALRLEMLSRAHVFAGDAALARSELLKADATILSERGLAERLVHLTEEAARLQPAKLLDQTASHLEVLETRGEVGMTDKAAGGPLRRARVQLMDLLRIEQATRSPEYMIEPAALGALLPR